MQSTGQHDCSGLVASQLCGPPIGLALTPIVGQLCGDEAQRGCGNVSVL